MGRNKLGIVPVPLQPQSAWPEKFGDNDSDLTFNEFLEAGFARVQLPVRLGFAPANADWRYMAGAGVCHPSVTRCILPYYRRLRPLEAIGHEVAQGEGRDGHIPTSPIQLRTDRTLPTWADDPAEAEQSPTPASDFSNP